MGFGPTARLGPRKNTDDGTTGPGVRRAKIGGQRQEPAVGRVVDGELGESKLAVPGDTAPYTHLRSCGITRLRGGNNAAQGNALGIADGPGEALKGRHTGTQMKTSAEGRTKEARGYFAPST